MNKLSSRTPSALEMAYADDLAKAESLAETRDEKEAVRLARVALQSNRMPDNHVVGILWSLSNKQLNQNKYGK